MLGECRRVLAAGGRIAGYVIHAAAGLTPAERRRAAELGPTDVLAPGDPEELTEAAGLSVIHQEEVTDEFYRTGAAVVRARRRLEVELRAAEGNELYEGEQAKKQRYLQGIREGLLQRSLTVAIKP